MPKTMRKKLTENFVLIGLALLSLALLSAGLWMVYDANGSHTVTIAADSLRDESYVMMQALQTVAARHYPSIKINVRQTIGSAESQQLLERGDVQLAAAQADIPAASSARTVASLFEEDFQLLVHKNSAIAQFADLKGKRIALPQSGGQYQSFLAVATHHGMKKNDFTFVGGDQERADQAFARGEADARFMVRSINNGAVAKLVAGGNANILPIDQALRVRTPAYVAATIPKGAYSVDPIVPAADVPTIGTVRVLMARRGVDNRVIRALTETLMERRQEMAAAISTQDAPVRTLVSQISQPGVVAGLTAVMHPGASSYYTPNPPSFVVAHLDSLTFFFAAFILAALWIAELRRTSWRVKKELADTYNRRSMALMEEAQISPSLAALEPVQGELMTLLQGAVEDLNRARLSEASFHSVNEVWRAGMEVIRNRRAVLDSERVSTVEGFTAINAGSGPVEPPSKWSLARFLHSKKN